MTVSVTVWALLANLLVRPAAPDLFSHDVVMRKPIVGFLYFTLSCSITPCRSLGTFSPQGSNHHSSEPSVTQYP